MALVEAIAAFGVEVLQPTSPPVAIPYVGDDSGIATVGLSVEEVNLAKQLDCESFLRLYKLLLFYELDLVQTPIHSLYRETRAPVFKTPIPIPIFIRVDPPTSFLKKYGIEDEQDAIGMFSLGWLDKYLSGYAPKTGDRIGYYDQEYSTAYVRSGGRPDQVVTQESIARVPNFSWEILTGKFGDFWGNTQIPLHLVCTLKNLRAPGRPNTNVTNR